MVHQRFVLFCAYTVLAVGLMSCALAQASEDSLTEAKQALRAGAYDEARPLFKALLDTSADTTGEATEGYFETFLARGDYADGLQEIEARLARRPNDALLLHLKGRLLVTVGRLEEAETAFRTAQSEQPDFWRNTLALGDLLAYTGRKRPAFNEYVEIYRPYQAGRFRTAETLGMAGQVAAKLEQFREANKAFRTAYQLDATLVQNLHWWAALFDEKYNEADAQRTYEEALSRNPHDPGLNAGYARSLSGFDAQETYARRALDTNPNFVDALNLLAELRILDAQYDEAETLLRQALAVNPSSIEALAHQASIHYLRDDSTAYLESEQQALSINPLAGSFYLTVAENASRRFRYPDAVVFNQQAVAVERDNPRAYSALGIGLMRVGRIDDAYRFLNASFERDPFDLFTGNTLTLLEEYADFDQLESEHFTLLIHQDESAVLGSAILNMAEACYDSLSARYPYVPSGKIRMEAYNDHDDFAVRVGGIPHLGLLGVSFGDIIALDTPQAQDPGSYNWARTLWHELAHTMAIGVSDFHVPRWFTEGLSVYEEQRVNPAWARDKDLELLSAFDQDKLLPLSDIDRGFTRPQFPGQIGLSYYHASKVIGFIVDRYGFNAVTALLMALRDGMSTAESVQRVLKVSLGDLNDAFMEHLGEERARLAPVLAGLPNPLGDEPAGSAAEGSVADNAFFSALRKGQDLLQAGDPEAAEPHFLDAIDLYPYWTEPGNAYQALAAIYRKRGDTARLMDITERFLEVSEHGAAEARELGTLLLEAGRSDEALRYFERSLHVDPYHAETRATLATLYAERNRHAEAVAERRAVLALNPVDQATAYYELARSLEANVQRPEAKRALLQALELAPGFRDAQRLLVDWVDQP